MLVLIACALRKWGAAEVSANPNEIVFLTGIGLAWILITMQLFSWLGVGARDDAIERRNPAALVAICGAIISVALVFTGGQLGEGPTYWGNIFSTGLGTAGLFCLWLFLELGTRISNSITEERDFGSGVRLAAFLMATGLVLARAVAGDWKSELATLQDFIHDGWWVVVIWLSAVMLEWVCKPSRRRPFPRWQVFGLFPSGLYLGLAAAWLYHVGPWEGMLK